MAEAISAKPPIWVPLLNSQFSSSRRHTLNLTPLRGHRSLQSRISQFKNTIQPNQLPLKPYTGNFGFSFVCRNGEGETEEEFVEETEQKRGESTMPARFRYLTKEAPDPPVRWPWFVALAFGLYAWRAVLWELSNWKKGLLAIGNFIGYLSKLALAMVFHFIGTPVTILIRSIETVLYTIRSVYAGIVAAAPVQELTVIILLTSTLLAIAEAAVPDSVNSQPYLLTLAGILSFAAVTDFIPELVFWLLLIGIFCFSRFFKNTDLVSAALPLAAALTAVGQSWLRLVVMTSYTALAIFHHSKKLSVSEGNSDVEATSTVKKLPVPLVVAGLTIGIHAAAKWARYRHLTWMIV